ncbi:substrate-binding domain-containing protein, partial [Frankia sp. Cpl3]|nr:substrate-binding domain-containing protein [Frankia sp. Cpl3]
YHIRYPQIAVKTRTGHSSDVIQYLLENIIHIGIVYIPPTLPNFEVIPTFEDEVVLVGPPDHSITGATSIEATELAKLPLLFMNWGSPFREWITQNLPRSYVPKLQVDKAELAIDLVKQKLGVSLLTRSTVKDELAAGTLREIAITGNTPPKRSAYIVLPREKKNRPSVEKWLGLMREFGYST